MPQYIKNITQPLIDDTATLHLPSALSKICGLDLFNTPLSGTTTGVCVGGAGKRSSPLLFQKRGAISVVEKAKRECVRFL